MKYKVDFLNKLEENNINKYQFTISLLNEGYRVGLLDKQMVFNIQKEIMILLKKLILKYTKKASTSVKVEVAEQINNSIFYALDTQLSSYNNLGESINSLMTDSIIDIYEKGYKLLGQMFDDAKRLFECIKENKLYIPLTLYQESIDIAIPLFFKNYDLKYDATNTMTLLDYPLIFDDMKVTGLIYMNNYLNNLHLETEFIKYFPNQVVIATLENFGEVYNSDYRETTLNIFEIVLNNSIFGAMLRDNITNIIISKSEFIILRDMLIELDKGKIKDIITEAINKIFKTLNITNKYLISYINSYKNNFLLRLYNLIKNDSLNHIIITENINKNKEVISLYSKDSMPNSEFRKLIKYIKELELSEKIKVIRSNIKSLDDLIDLLSSSCLFGNEYLSLYNEMEDFEVSILGKIVFYEELRNETFALDNIYNDNLQYEWEEYFVEFIKNLNIESKNRILDFMNKHKIDIYR